MQVRRALIACTAVVLVCTVPAQAATVRYTVRYGDTLTWIARDHHVGLLALARMNHLDAYGILVAGTTIRVPAPPRHHAAPRGHAVHRRPHRRPPPLATRLVVVRPGDSLWAIAARAGTTAARLAALNHRPESALLPVGLRLRVPVSHARPRRRVRHHVAVRPLPRGVVPWTLSRWALRYGIDPRLVLAVSWQESGWHRGLVSRTGATGVMQVMPQTWDYVERDLIGRRVPHTLSGNAQIGVAYLAHLLHVFAGNARLAVAGYYQGEGAVRLFGVLPVSERYVADVLALRRRM